MMCGESQIHLCFLSLLHTISDMTRKLIAITCCAYCILPLHDVFCVKEEGAVREPVEGGRRGIDIYIYIYI